MSACIIGKFCIELFICFFIGFLPGKTFPAIV